MAPGRGVTGAFLGSAASLILIAAVLAAPLFSPLPPATADSGERLRDLLAGAWIPVIGLTLLFLLQEVHIIVVKHEASSDAAGSVRWRPAAKAIIWVAIGLGMYLFPEAARRAKLGSDTRPILLRTLGLIAAASVPMVLISAVAAKPLLSAVFGPDKTEASGALPAEPGDGAARVRLPVGPVPARARARPLHLGARHGGRGRGRPAGRGGRRPRERGARPVRLQIVCAATLLTLALRRSPSASEPAPISPFSQALATG